MKPEKTQRPVQSGSISIHLSPGASKNEVTQVDKETVVWIKLTAPPVEGKANLQLVKYLADILDVAVSKVTITSGLKSRIKRVTMKGLPVEEILARLKQMSAK